MFTVNHYTEISLALIRIKIFFYIRNYNCKLLISIKINQRNKKYHLIIANKTNCYAYKMVKNILRHNVFKTMLM